MIISIKYVLTLVTEACIGQLNHGWYLVVAIGLLYERLTHRFEKPGLPGQIYKNGIISQPEVTKEMKEI